MKMSRRILIAVLCLLAFAGSIRKAPADPSPYVPAGIVVLPVTVMMPDGRPARETTITLSSMERMMLQIGLDAERLDPVITDTAGSATLHYPTQIAAKDNPARTWSALPLYALVAPQEGHAGAITGLPEKVADGDSLTIRITEGYTLKGSVVDKNGEPLKGISVRINHDLKAETHTGYGGEIWERKTQTNGEGRFTFQHVNASAVTINPALSPNFYWAKTTINGRVIHDRVDEFQPDWNNTDNQIIIHAAKSPAKIYHGVAVDSDGKPVAGASVTVGFSWHLEERTWSDSHSWESTETLSDGSWRVEIPTKWVTWGSIRKRGEPGPQEGTAQIALSGGINIKCETSQTVVLAPDESGRLMPAGRVVD